MYYDKLWLSFGTWGLLRNPTIFNIHNTVGQWDDGMTVLLSDGPMFFFDELEIIQVLFEDVFQEFIRKDGRKELLYYVNLIRAC